MARHISFIALVGLLSLSGWLTLAADRPKSERKPQNSKPAAAQDVDDLLEAAVQGIPVRLVSAFEPELKLATRLYWRTFQGAIAAETVPAEIRLDDSVIIASQFDPDLLATGGPESKLRPTTGFAKLDANEDQLLPGKIALSLKDGKPTSKHPAIKVVETKAGPEIQIRCRPVVFEALDKHGSPAPQPFDLFSDDKSLLRKPPVISTLKIWLPVGLNYRSTWGQFAIAADGTLQISKSTLASGVQSTDAGLRKITSAGPATPAIKPATDLIVLPATRPVKLFVPIRIDPGQPLLLAADRDSYQTSLEVPFAADHFSVKTSTSTVVTGRPVDAPANETVARAAQRLGTKADRLAWFALSLDADLGAHAVTIDTKAGPVTHRYLVSSLGQGMYLVPPRLRTVFSGQEHPEFNLLLPGGFPGGKAKVLVGNQEFGSIDLPPVPKEVSYDSRSLNIDMSRLPLGDRSLVVRSGALATQSLPIKIVSLSPRSPFFMHYMAWGGAPPESDEGLQALEDAGMETVVNGTPLEFVMPRIDAELAATFGQGSERLPPELCLIRTRNDQRLERMLKHRLRHVDFAVSRQHGFYNEGLSYHHSHPASVERVIRNLQIFSQQVADYPSFAGINYSWFPQMYGYVEGGVPTDAWVGERNRLLAEKLTEEGATPLTPDQQKWYLDHRGDTDQKSRQKALELQSQAVRHWKTSYELGFGRHNKLYNDAIRQVRPDLTNTLYENAGHDSGKRPESVFADMPAASYFTMSDYGDWPMSAAFTTDWSRAQSGKDVWLTAEFLNSTEGETKQLFHAFARGLAGGGLPMSERYGLAELKRRGKVLRFLSQYGAIAKQVTPDRQVALLATNAKHAFQGNGSYDLHAAYYHLTRLGLPPAIVSEDAWTAGKDAVSPDTKVLILVNVDDPLTDPIVDAIRKFQQRGGKVLVIGPEVAEVKADGTLPDRLQSMWVGGPGFMRTTHAWLWQQFSELRHPLGDALKTAGVTPKVLVDPEHGFALVQEGMGVRYITVIADRANTQVDVFEREPTLSVTLPEAGWIVRELRQQVDLPTEVRSGQATVKVDLSTEPTTILACYREPFSRVTLKVTGDKLQCDVLDRREMHIDVPIRLRVLAEDGAEVHSVFAGSSKPVSWDDFQLAGPGAYTIEVQELVTGLTTTLSVTVGDKAAKPAVQLLGDVSAGTVMLTEPLPRRAVILIEPGRSEFVPVAKDLAQQLQATGADVSVKELQSQDFDTQPNRWFLRPDDEQRAGLMHEGKLIGFRQNLAAYIDRQKAVHVPERGGYGTVAPDFDIPQDCILFSGGMLADSLKIVTAGLESPHTPGRGQAKLVRVHSPFHANYDAVVIVSHDRDGYSAGAKKLAALWSTKPEDPSLVADSQPTLDVSKAAPKPEVQRRDVAQPYATLTPYRRIEHLVANAKGQAAVLLRDGAGVVLLNESGEATAAVKATGLLPRIDDDGRLWTLAVDEHDHKSAITLECLATDGKQALKLPVYHGEMSPPGMLAGFIPAPSGKSAATGQPGRVLFGSLPAGSEKASEWGFYDDAPFAGQRFAVLYPRMPIAMEYSPDGRYLCVSLDTRPPLNNMSGPVFHPTFCETLLIDTQTGERVWSLRDELPNQSRYAVHRGFLAVARDARRVALADYDGNLFVIGSDGIPVFQSEVAAPDRTVTGRLGPKDGVAVGISDEGTLAAFAFRSRLRLVRDADLQEIAVGPIASLSVARDGSHVVVGTENGELRAFDADGKPLWTKEIALGPIALAAVGVNQVLAGTSDGEVVLLGADGAEIRRTNVYQIAKQTAHSLEPGKNFQALPEPYIYQPASTLEVAQKRLKAKPNSQWKGQGASRTAFGREFHRVDKAIELTAAGEGECFLHLVYRRPEGNESLTVTTEGAGGKETFELDLPTPSYRVIDLPVRGPNAKVTVIPRGAVEIAECSLWTFTWPSANEAFVNSSQPQTTAKVESKDLADDLLEDLKVNTTVSQSGKMKSCRVWWPNMDPDRTKGRFLPAPSDPLTMVDGKRFGNGKATPWSSGLSTAWGASLTIDFGKEPTPVSLVATYERTTKQSQVSRHLMVFSGVIKGEHDSPPALATAIGNDQFWRLFDFPTAKVQSLGIHVLSGSGTDGLSELEVYR
ncbi:MAG: hypothetical protein JWN70_5198 [Planctomycetaceae bacterium]|nr:hypothetical protein [Planctomycetaceae bacterium]